jgi:hypothetical protein
MPLARIISSSAKYSNGLADDLRSRGFQVLTSAPGDNVSGSADLEITLNECLAEEARAAADSVETKDMRVFLTPQAFAGNIRSIEMFVLTPKRVVVPKIEIPRVEVDTPVEPAAVPASAGNILEFAVPAESVVNEVSANQHNADDVSNNENVEVNISADATEELVTTPEVEVLLDNLEESDEPGFASSEESAPVVEMTPSDPPSTIGRAILASKQSAWPDMAEMKLVPAELAPVTVKVAGLPPRIAPLPERNSSANPGSAHVLRDGRFWKVPIVAGIVAVLSLSMLWLAGSLSASHAQTGGTSQQINPSPLEAAAPVPATPMTQPREATESPTLVTRVTPARKVVFTPDRTKAHPQHARPKRRSSAESDYVAKDTTVYFSKPATGQQGSQKIQSRP